MKRPTAIFSTLVSAALLVALTPGVANAANVTAYNRDGTTTHSISVNTSAKVASKGKKVEWRVKIKCPKGEKYHVVTNIAQTPSALPKYPGAKVGYVWATWTKDGTCSGKNQSFTPSLKVQKTSVTPVGGETIQLLVPIVKAPEAHLAQAYLSTNLNGDRGEPYYCSFVPSPDEDGTSCEDYTLLGPTIRLR